MVLKELTGDENLSGDLRGTVVFFSLDALGHINPMLSTMKELRRRKFRVLVLTLWPLKEAQSLRAQGLEVESCCEGAAWKRQQCDRRAKNVVKTLMNSFSKGLVSAFKANYSLEGVVGQFMDDIIEYHDLIEAKLRSFKPDLIVVDHVVHIPCCTTVAKRWVRSYSGFPTTLISYENPDKFVPYLGLKRREMTSEAMRLVKEMKRPVLERSRRYWSKLALWDEKLWPCDQDLVPVSPHLNFYYGPNELGFDREQPALKALDSCWLRLEHTIEQCQPKARNDKHSQPDFLRHLPGKLIYLSLGTLVSSDANMMNRLLAMLSKSPNRFIVSMGQMHADIKLYENMWGHEFVDQKAILTQADLFITHGGHNSIIEAFFYGVPGLIVLPVFSDQFDSAQRVEDCGFGVRLNPFDCREEDLLSSIDSLLANEELHMRMKSIGMRMSKIRYHEMAANHLERLMQAP